MPVDDRNTASENAVTNRKATKQVFMDRASSASSISAIRMVATTYRRFSDDRTAPLRPNFSAILTRRRGKRAGLYYAPIAESRLHQPITTACSGPGSLTEYSWDGLPACQNCSRSACLSRQAGCLSHFSGKLQVTYRQLFVWEVVAVSVPDRFGSTIGVSWINWHVAEGQGSKAALAVEQVVGVPIGAVEVGHSRGLCWPLQLQRDATAVR